MKTQRIFGAILIGIAILGLIVCPEEGAGCVFVGVLGVAALVSHKNFCP